MPKWYIVVITTHDWYTILEGIKIVEAFSAGEADVKALSSLGYTNLDRVEVTYGPFDTYPKEAQNELEMS